jgi:hypothetical protein
MRRSPPTEQKKDAVREQAWRGRQWETNEAKQEQSSLGAHAMRSDQARVASSREETGGLGGQNKRVRIASAPYTLSKLPSALAPSSHSELPYASAPTPQRRHPNASAPTPQRRRPKRWRLHPNRSSPTHWRLHHTWSSLMLWRPRVRSNGARLRCGGGRRALVRGR